MIKLIGIALTVLSSIGIGFSYSKELSKNLDQLKKLKKLIYMLKSEIKYSKSPLPEAFESIGQRIEEPFSHFLLSVSEELSQLTGKTFRQVWSLNIDETLKDSALTPSDKEQLRRLGETMGYLDKEMQENTINLYLEQLEVAIEESRKTMENKTKVYNCLGVTVGLFLAIILI